MKRKILSWLLMVLLMATAFPSMVLGASVTAAAPAATNANISLEEAIQSVKQNFIIPSALTQFTSSFDSSTKQLRWHLNWSAEDNGSGNFSADVDAATGEIVNLYRWSNNSDPTSKTPSLSISEAQKAGQDLLNRLIPDKVGNLILQDNNNLLPLGDNQSSSYYMTWARQYKNVPVSMDGASMEINMQTGEVTSYNLNWTDEVFPDPSNVITIEKAQQSFVDAGILQMQYRLLPSHIIMKLAATDNSAAPLLIYGIRHPSNGMIDAVTGQPFTYYNDNSYGGGDKMINQNSSTVAAPIPLTPEEQQEVDSVAKFISQENAIKAVKQYLAIPADMELESASLEKNWQYPELRTWSLSWQVQSKDADKSSSLWAQVDASTGELLSFSANSSADENKNNSISETNARNLAENFIQKIQPQRWSQLKLNDMNATVVVPLNQKQSSWSFSYLRLVNGVICPDNGVNITVDANDTRQIVQYNLNWSPAVFPSSSTALTKDKANAAFLKVVPLKLSYMMLADKNGNQEMKLVYAPEYKDNLTMIDANSGSGLDSTGKPVSENPRAYVFNDIKDHFAAKEIAILGQAGLFGEYGNSFHPNENISLISLLRAMLSSREGLSSTLNMKDEEILKQSQSLGWITADVSAGNSVSRELLAQLMVRYLKIEYLAQIQGIYQLPYLDSAQMPASLRGYAALTYGLGIIKADGKYFNSQHLVTRGEAAVALVHTLSVKTQP